MKIVAGLSFDTANMVQFITELLNIKDGVWRHAMENQEIIIMFTGDINKVRQAVLIEVEKSLDIKPS